MADLPDAVYEAAAARLAVTDALAPLALLHQMDYEPAERQIREAARVMVDAVAPLLIAEGRRQAAEAIWERVGIEHLPPVLLRSGALLRSAEIAEWAATIAEGTDA